MICRMAYILFSAEEVKIRSGLSTGKPGRGWLDARKQGEDRRQTALICTAMEWAQMFPAVCRGRILGSDIELHTGMHLIYQEAMVLWI